MSQLQVWIRMHKRRTMPIPTRWGWWAAKQKVEEQWWEGTVVFFLTRVCTLGLFFQRYRATEEVYSAWNGKLGSNHTVKFSKGTRHHMKIRTRKGPSQGVVKKCEPQERNPCSPTFDDRTQQETLQQERCARREAWDLAKSLQAQKMRIRLRSLLPKDGKWRYPRWERQKSENRGRFQSIGAHAEQQGFELNRTGNPSKIQEPHNGGDSQWESANEWGNTSICSRSWSLQDSYSRTSLQFYRLESSAKSTVKPTSGPAVKKPHLTKNVGNIQCNTEDFAPIVFLGLPTGSASSSASTSSTSLLQDTTDDSSSRPATARRRSTSIPILRDQLRDPTETQNKNKHRNIIPASGNQLRDLPEWLKEFTENPEDEGVLAAKDTPADSDSELPTKVATQEAQYFYSLPKRPKLWGLQANQDHKESLEEAHWRSSTSARKIRWIDHSRSQSSFRRWWISKQVRRLKWGVRVQGL